MYDNNGNFFLERGISHEQALAIGRKYWKDCLEEKVNKHVGNTDTGFDSIEDIKKEIAFRYPKTDVTYLLNEHPLDFATRTGQN